MSESDRLVHLVDNRIGEFLDDCDPILLSLAGDLAPFSEFSRQLLSGGKRLRPQFCYWGWRAVQSDPRPADPVARDALLDELDSLVDLCAGLEFFHAAALVHDDIIDNSDTRRKEPSAHRKFESLHRDEGWWGNSEQFGRASAILFGDLLLAWADELIVEAACRLRKPTSGRAVRAEFATMRREVTLGQYLDILEERVWTRIDDADARERAERVMMYKSAKYSVQAPLILGATIHTASVKQLEALQSYGLNVGLAFQLRDDVLGVFGDPQLTGKPSGDDLREGKRTLLIALTREKLSGGGRRLVDELLGDPDLSSEQIEILQRTIVESGALDLVERMIADYTAVAMEALDNGPLEESAALELAKLAERMVKRSA